ncbi:MAG: RNA polymerase sigma factor RpoH [Gammaproteobacteria bacterium]|nr:RNA polymerase sigma factor RpoH [Gammaproteobacteria bacterium]
MTMNQTMLIPVEVPGSQGLAAYIQAVNAAPMLSADEELELALRYRQESDLDAARELVLAHLRHVVRVARGFSGYGLPLADLIQEGNIGLMKAVKNYDPLRGVRLVSFAVHWIRAEMYDFVLRNWRIVKVATTKAQRKLFFNLRKSKNHLGWMSPDEVEALATKLDVPAETVLEMESRLGGADVAFDGPDNDDEMIASPSGYLPDMRYNPERLASEASSESLRNEQLEAALTSLDERSRNIVKRRWLEGKKSTLHELAAEYAVSAERIRQIEKRAFKVMRDQIQA